MSKIDELIQQLCPDGVEYRELGEIAKILNGFAFKSSKYAPKGIRVIRISDVQKGKMSDKDLKYYPVELQPEIERYLLEEGDLVMSLTGNTGRVAMLSKSDLPAGLNQRVACIRPGEKILARYLFHFFDRDEFETEAMNNSTGGGQKNMSTVWLSKFKIPIPPLEIQREIVDILDKFTQLEAELEAELEARKKQYEFYRNQLLTFDDMGGVRWTTLGEMLNYEQPGKYIVKSTEYSPEYKIPVLTAGQSFILGNTDEEVGIYNASEKNPVIIFDDFTTSNHWVDFNFKIKSSAMKLLTPKSNDFNFRYIYHFIKTIRYEPQDHARQWISTYANFKIAIPPLAEQNRIVAILDKFDALVSDISIGLPAELAARRKQYEHYRSQLLTFPEKMV